MRLADELGLPVVTLGRHPRRAPGHGGRGARPGHGHRGEHPAMSELPVPVVSVVTGEGGSGGALALAVANHGADAGTRLYSVISPEGCAAILYGDPARGAERPRPCASPRPSCCVLGVVDGVVREPDGGAQADTGRGRRAGCASALSCGALAALDAPADRRAVCATAPVPTLVYRRPGGPVPRWPSRQTGRSDAAAASAPRQKSAAWSRPYRVRSPSVSLRVPVTLSWRSAGPTARPARPRRPRGVVAAAPPEPAEPADPGSGEIVAAARSAPSTRRRNPAPRRSSEPATGSRPASRSASSRR